MAPPGSIYIGQIVDPAEHPYIAAWWEDNPPDPAQFRRDFPRLTETLDKVATPVIPYAERVVDMAHRAEPYAKRYFRDAAWSSPMNQTEGDEIREVEEATGWIYCGRI
jgi:hypothetical protein